jgi:hypothetical protein
MNSERTPPRGYACLLAWLAATGSGCDIVQGYQDAGDALFPDQSTHVAAPGLRLVSGRYRELDVIAGSELYLLAREADDATGKLVSMRYADPDPCELRGVGRYSTTREPGRSAPLIAYFDEDVRSGTLRFADARCRTYSLVFDDARLPVSETHRGVVVWSGTDLWLATPETGRRQRLASGVSEVIRRVFGDRYAVIQDGRLTLFDADWKPQGTFGSQVSSVLRAGGSLFYVDQLGAHRIVVGRDGSDGVESRLLAADACGLASEEEPWVTLHSPCSSGKVVAIHEPTGKSYSLPFQTDAGQVKLVPAANSPGKDPVTDPFWFFYLRSAEPESSPETLYVRTPGGEELALGPRATLRHLRVFDSAAEPYGYALIEVADETGRYIWWNAAGDTRVLAENVMWRPERLIVDYDGSFGKLAVGSGNRLAILAERVLWQDLEYQDASRQWTALFHDVEATGAGQLSVFYDSIDALEAASEAKPLELPELIPVASNAIAFGTSSLDDVLPGVSYLRDYDLSARTGRLEYRNLELRFTARVNEGVSDYLLSDDEILYTIPYGDDAGIWLAASK